MNSLGMSDATIEGMTGIPRSTLGFVRRGERNLPSEYLNTLRNTYRRSAYNDLRSEAMPFHQARKYSSGSARKVQEVGVEMRMLVTQSTRGALTGALAKLEKQGIIPNMKDLQAKMLEAVRKGYMKSQKSFEDFQDYLFRKSK